MDPSVVTAKNPSMDSTEHARTQDNMVQLMLERLWARQFLFSFVMCIFSEAPESPGVVSRSSSKCLNDTCRAVLVKLEAAISLVSANAAQLLPVFSFPSVAPGSVGTIVEFQCVKWKTTGKSSELGSCTLSWLASHLRLSETICERGTLG